MATKTHIALLAAALSLSLLVSSSLGQRDVRSRHRLSEEQQCRFQHISSSQPSQRIESEGGTVELWEQWEDQFQCAGVQPLKYTIRPRGLALPNYQPLPRLIFVEQGEGFLGVTFPGCAETYHSGQGQREPREEEHRGEEEEAGSRRDMHQKVHRIRKGDIIAIPVGAVHWCYNDGNEELVTVTINDLNHQSNQLDQNFRSFFLAGGVRSGQQEESHRGERRGEHEHELSEKFQNIFREFDTKLLAEAYNVPEQTIEQMQRGQEERGLIVTVREKMRFIRPDEEREQGEYSWGGRGRSQRDAEGHNGLEESFCAMKIRTNIETRKETDVYSREAGKLNIVDRHKLPILKFVDMSAERGSLYQSALLSPNWDAHGHTIVYVTKGEAQVQIVDHRGQAKMNDRVRRGDMFVVPQYYIATFRAQQNGYEWVGFKTTGWPMRHSVSGYTSVFRAMPLEVVANAYQVSPVQGQRLKLGRGSQSFLLSPGSRQY